MATKAQLETLVEELKTRITQLEGELALKLKETTARLPKAVANLKAATGIFPESPLWSRLQVKRLADGSISVWFSSEDYRVSMTDCRKFNNALMLSLRKLGHEAKFRRDHLRVILKAVPLAPPEPQDSEPEFDDGPSDEALARQAEDAALRQAEANAAELI